MVATLAAGIAIAVSAVLGYDAVLGALNMRENEHKQAVIDEYGISIDISEEEMEALSDEEKAKYEAADKAFGERCLADEIWVELRGLAINLSFWIIGISLLFAFLVLEFAVPLFLRNGRSLGKKIFGIALMQTNGTRVKSVSVFVRSILGKFTVETMIPVYVIVPFFYGGGNIVGVFVIAAVLVVQIGMMMGTKTNSALHDGLASTVVVDYATQMIFETEEELMEYKKKLAAKIAEERKY